MALVLNPNLAVPIEFVDAQGVRHAGISWARLILDLTTYRSRNRLPLGDPEREVMAQVCQRWPDRCTSTDVSRLPELEDDLNYRVLNWVVRVFESNLRTVDESTARRRIEICSVCPRQKDWRGKCGSCAARVDQLEGKLLEGKPLIYSSELKGCAALSEDTRASVWLDQVSISPESARLPVECWRKA